MPGLDFLLNAWKVIKGELPKFATDMNLPFSADPEPRSVMDKLAPIPTKQAANYQAANQDTAEKRITENLLAGLALLSPAKRAVVPAAKAALESPLTTSAMMAAITGDPTNLIPGKLGAVVGGSVGDAEGAIMPGGRPDLLMTHAASSPGKYVSEILARLGSGKISELTHPSIAIASNDARPFSNSDISLLFNPTSNRFDPEQQIYNQLFNRDVYTYRRNGIPPNPRDYRLTEGNNPDSTGQLLSILASPRFSSFKQFEISPFGAGVLGKSREELDKIYLNSNTHSEFYDLVDKFGLDKYAGKETNFAALENLGRLGNKDAAKFVEGVRATPTAYAELKIPEELPLNSSTLSAVLLPHNAFFGNTSQKRLIIAAQDELNVPVGTAADLIPAHMESVYSDLIDFIAQDVTAAQKNYKPGTGQSLLSLVSDTTKKYVPRVNIQEAIISGGVRDRDAIKDTIFGGRQFEADVASMITAKDIDDAIAEATRYGTK